MPNLRDRLVSFGAGLLVIVLALLVVVAVLNAQNNGTLSHAEALRQAGIIQRWRDMLEKEQRDAAARKAAK